MLAARFDKNRPLCFGILLHRKEVVIVLLDIARIHRGHKRLSIYAELFGLTFYWSL